MQIIIEPSSASRDIAFMRPQLETVRLEHLVDEVFSAVQLEGDEAVLRYTQLFDKTAITTLRVTEQEINDAIQLVSEELKEAIKMARKNIEQFHRSQISVVQKQETMPGVLCWQEARAITSVGIYIPGGTAPLFSTVLMLAVPAAIAGCKEVVLCSPPNQEGNIHPAILYAAHLCGVTTIIKAGGIQAIAALSLGTATVPKVYKIFGPGNQYVVAAKQAALKMGTAIDLPAGPSEVMVVADERAVPAFVAADLLSQAEHGADSQVICVVNNEITLQAIKQEIEQQIEAIPRKEIARQALENSKLVLLRRSQDILDSINQYAPEHLILCTSDNDFYINQIQNAGSVFIGNYTPESAGDYASGTNHTLPTNGYAKAYSGVNMDAFVKKITFQEISPSGLALLGPAIETMAKAEQLDAHGNAVTLRLKYLKKI